MIVLGIDTALPACSVALTRDGTALARLSEPMMRGHQERLAQMVEAVMAAAGLPFAAIDRVAVTVGPGSFTGLRVGLAFAKALALALDRPCVGVGCLDALARSAGTAGLTMAVIDARRGQVYLQAFADGRAVTAPDTADIAAAAALIVEVAAGRPVTLVGSGAALVGAPGEGWTTLPLDAPDPVIVARLGEAAPLTSARPLYLRAPDARLPDR